MDERLTEQEALKRFYLVDMDGLVHEGMSDLMPIQRKFAQSIEAISSGKIEAISSGKSTVMNGQISLLDVVKNIDATLLIGVSTQPGLFTEAVVREMASKTKRPLIFPLSNPTNRAEAVPSDLIAWTDGRALVATGAPFAPVKFQGKTIHIGQANNFYIFPAIGLCVAATHTRRITDAMLRAAARALSETSPILNDPTAAMLPPLENIEEVSTKIAFAAGKMAQAEGHAAKISDEELMSRIKNCFWAPTYPQMEHIN